jgi:hypothetical protein
MWSCSKRGSGWNRGRGRGLGSCHGGGAGTGGGGGGAGGRGGCLGAKRERGWWMPRGGPPAGHPRHVEARPRTDQRRRGGAAWRGASPGQAAATTAAAWAPAPRCAGAWWGTRMWRQARILTNTSTGGEEGGRRYARRTRRRFFRVRKQKTVRDRRFFQSPDKMGPRLHVPLFTDAEGVLWRQPNTVAATCNQG